jgi:hypothetical protein
MTAMLGTCMPSASADETAGVLNLGTWSFNASTVDADTPVNPAAVTKLASIEQDAATRAANAAKTCTASSDLSHVETASDSKNLPDFGPIIVGSYDHVCDGYPYSGFVPWTTRDITGTAWAEYLGTSTPYRVCLANYFRVKTIAGSVSVPPSANLSDQQQSPLSGCSTTYYNISHYDNVHFGAIYIVYTQHEADGLYQFNGGGFSFSDSCTWTTAI